MVTLQSVWWCSRSCLKVSLKIDQWIQCSEILKKPASEYSECWSRSLTLWSRLFKWLALTAKLSRDAFRAKLLPKAIILCTLLNLRNSVFMTLSKSWHTVLTALSWKDSVTVIAKDHFLSCTSQYDELPQCSDTASHAPYNRRSTSTDIRLNLPSAWEALGSCHLDAADQNVLHCRWVK